MSKRLLLFRNGERPHPKVLACTNPRFLHVASCKYCIYSFVTRGTKRVTCGERECLMKNRRRHAAAWARKNLKTHS